MTGFLRGLLRHRLATALNVLGLALGVAVFLVLMLAVRFEASFDRWIPGAGTLYRVDSVWHNDGRPTMEANGVGFASLDALRADNAAIADGTRLLRKRVTVRVGSLVDSEMADLVDPNFLDLVRLPLTLGRRSQALSSPDVVVLSETLARRFFGSINVLGRELELVQGGTRRSYRVSAILRDLPRNTTLSADLLVRRPPVPLDGNLLQEAPDASGTVYLSIPNRAAALRVIAGMPNFIERWSARSGAAARGENIQRYYGQTLVRLTDAHFHDVDIMGGSGTDRRLVWSLAAIGMLALAASMVNCVNLATARSGLRAREVAMRLVCGATRRGLMLRFLSESLLLASVSVLLGLALAELALPLVNARDGSDLVLPYRDLLLWLPVLALGTGLGSGFYPALVLTRFRPAAVLAASRTPSGGRGGQRLRDLLVLSQFTCATCIVAGTLVVDAQARLLRSGGRGFDRQQLMLLLSVSADGVASRQAAIMDRMRAVPGVVSVTLGTQAPAGGTTGSVAAHVAGHPDPQPTLSYAMIGRDYFRTYGIRLLAGRVFDDGHHADDWGLQAGPARVLNTVISRGAVRALGFGDPQKALDHRFWFRNDADNRTDLRIVGVVEDVRFMSPRAPVLAQFYVYDTAAMDGSAGAIRYAGADAAEMRRRLTHAWAEVAPDEPFRIQDADDRLQIYIRPDAQRARLFSAGSVLAILIACLGLYGLAAFTASRRLREIGIRKAVGASTGSVLVLLVRQFLRPVLLGSLIACPLAWFPLHGWLAGFDQRVALSPLPFAAAVVITLGLAVVTVLGQSWRLACAEPAHALRKE